MLAIYKREMRSYFVSPIGYIYLAIFLAVSGVTFSVTTLKAGNASDITQYFSYLLISFFVVLPLLTMKLFSDEKRLRTETLLISSPVSLSGMVAAKFLAAFSMFMIGFAISLIDLLPFYAYASGSPKSFSTSSPVPTGTVDLTATTASVGKKGAISLTAPNR